jgi:hypothetical protein
MPDRPAGSGTWQRRGELACMLCARITADVQGPRDGRPGTNVVRPCAPEHAESVRRLRCPHCAGRLWFRDSDDVFVDRRPLADDDLHPRRGRPRKSD